MGVGLGVGDVLRMQIIGEVRRAELALDVVGCAAKCNRSLWMTIPIKREKRTRQLFLYWTYNQAKCFEPEGNKIGVSDKTINL